MRGVKRVVYTNRIVQLLFVLGGQPAETGDVETIANRVIVGSRNLGSMNHGLHAGIEPKSERIVCHHVVGVNRNPRRGIAAGINGCVRGSCRGIEA